MAITFENIEAIENGANFYTADLHVHSFGGSADVKDPSMTIETIIEAAVQHGISLLAITDHNCVENVPRALDYATKHAGKLLLLPAVEISTAHGHLLVYYPPEKFQSVRDLLGAVKIVGQHGAKDSHTVQAMASVIAEAERTGGICIAAHVDRATTGFETAAGYPTWKKDIVCSGGLYGIEVDDPSRHNWFTPDDEATAQGAERKKLLVARSQAPGLAARARLAVVQNSDSHALADFEAQHRKRSLTRYKMHELSFDGFRTALVDPQARVRAVSTLPTAVPRILGMQLTGGFLDGNTFHFSDNLNCLIGGRGTGKSTGIRSIAYALGQREDFGEQDNCPNQIVLYAEDENGVRYRYERMRGQEPMVQAKEDRSIRDVPADAFRIEYYGQGDLAEVAKDPLGHPAKLQDFLDRHIVLGDLREREASLIAQLRENSAQLLPLETSAEQLPAKQASAREIAKKLEVAEQGKLQEVAALSTRLTAEKSLRDSLVAAAKLYSGGMSLASFKRDYTTLADNSGALTGDARVAPVLAAMKTLVGEAAVFLDTEQKVLNSKLATIATAIEAEVAKLETQHRVIEQEIAAKIAEFQKQGLSGDLKGLNQLLLQRTNLTKEITRITNQSAELTRLRDQRTGLLQDLSATREEMMQRRKAQLSGINQKLRITIEDYTIVIYYDDAGIADEFTAALAKAMHGSFFHDETAALFCTATTPAAFAEMLHNRDVAALAAIARIGREWAEQLQSRCGLLSQRHAFEVIAKPGRPVIKVLTRGSNPREIPVSGLSDGQKHTILLTIAMLADSKHPLVMDQPEDDLDNAFIFRSIVATLRHIKEHRQVIVVTHNANIAVLGDSEIIFPMQRTENAGKIVERGSIDRRETAQQVQEILEGGELAFRRRQAIYGH